MDNAEGLKPTYKSKENSLELDSQLIFAIFFGDCSLKKK